MKVVTSKFNKEELEHILNSNPKMGNLEDLSMYNEANYFQIKQMIKENKLIGYAVIFLGYNGLESNDISIEDIAYWGKDIEYVENMSILLEEIKNSHYPFPVDNIYYDDEKYYGLGLTFERLGYITKGQTR